MGAEIERQEVTVTAARVAAISNDDVAEQAAGECLLAGGSALAAVLSGFFGAAGAHAGVLLGPVSILVAGVGSGVRAFDGRLRQPGLGAKRPRGFRETDRVPEAAYVAVPSAMSAIAVAQAYDEDRSLGAVVRYGIEHAQRVGAESRAEAMQVVRGLGALAFSDPAFSRPLLHVAGASEGGNLTSGDFAAVPTDIDVPARVHPEQYGWFEVPWADDGTAPTAKRSGGQTVVVAFDSRGNAAAIGFGRASDGVSIDALELEAPRAAIPVLRGIARVAPGERIPCSASMAILFDAGRPTAVVASPSVARLGQTELEAPQLSIQRDPMSRVVVVSRRVD